MMHRLRRCQGRWRKELLSEQPVNYCGGLCLRGLWLAGAVALCLLPGYPRRQLWRESFQLLSISFPELTERLAVLLEVRCREVVDFVLLQKGVDLHARFETKEPPKLCSGEGTRPICLEC